MSASKTVFPARGPLKGNYSVPGDKSISHRSVIFASLAEGQSEIHGFLKGEDCLNTLRCFQQMGIEHQFDGEVLRIEGRGLHGLKAPCEELYVGNSGTSIRLLSGLLAGQTFASKISGDDSICRRPMKRIIDPLRQMGAKIDGTDLKAPLSIEPATLQGIAYGCPVASAQVKSCLLLAGLYAQGPTELGEPHLSRNHSELMFKQFGGTLQASEQFAVGLVLPAQTDTLKAQTLMIPGDISSAAFWIVAALIVPGSEICLKNVGVNPTRDALLTVLNAMGADLRIELHEQGVEPMADIWVKYSKLKGTHIDGQLIPGLIDEIPILCIAAALAEGTTEISDAAELRVKESDRISTMLETLTKLGVTVQEKPDGLIIEGQQSFRPEHFRSFGDHRVAMSVAIAALRAEGPLEIDDVQCVSTSFPGFFQGLEEMSQI